MEKNSDFKRIENKFRLFILIILMIFFGAGFFIATKRTDSNNPEKVMDSLYKGIEISREKGDYKCCIEPPCTMCYLGKWKFERGTCFCDEAILEGRYEDVCPECKNGVETGICNTVSECEEEKL